MLNCTTLLVLLVVDDDPSIGDWLEGIVDGRRYRVERVATAAAASRRIDEACPDVVLLDEILPDESGLKLLQSIRRRHARLPVLILAATRDAQTSIDAIKYGANDCLRKPLEIAAVRAAIAAAEPPPPAKDELGLAGSNDGMTSSLIGEGPLMQRVFKAIGQAACSLQPTLIWGAPGTGKETVSRTLHRSTLASGLLTFYFCPAGETKTAPWEEAGELLCKDQRPMTLVLQEIGELSLAAQTRLFERLCVSNRQNARDNDSLVARNVRMVATSSIDLAPAVRSGEFRADLYYALSVHRIALPRLSERLDDLPLLIRRFALEDVGQEGDDSRAWTRLTPTVLQSLRFYSWPGNLDELAGFVRSCRGPLGPIQWIMPRLEDLHSRYNELELNGNARPDSLRFGSLSADVSDLSTNWHHFVSERLRTGSEDLHAAAIAEAESKFLQLVLDHTQGNQAQAARLLGITRASLRKKIRLLRLAVG